MVPSKRRPNKLDAAWFQFCRASGKARQHGFTLAEAMVAVGIGSIVMAAVMSYSIYFAQSSCAVGNYIDLDMKSRNALDIMSCDIRQASGCISNAFSSTNLTLAMNDPASGQAYTINYSYDSVSGTMTRTYAVTGSVSSTLLLTNCTSFSFSYFQRNPTNGAWEAFPNDPGRADECKLVRLDWTCSRYVLGRIINSETMESAKVVIRKD